MKFPGRIYQGKQGIHLALYNFHPDIWMACPDSLKGKAQRLGHVSYRYGGYSGGIDLFKLKERCKIPEIRLQQQSTRLNKRWIQGVDERQDVQYEIKKNAPEELLYLIREDVRRFVRKRKNNPSAKNPIGTNINRVSVLESKTEIKFINSWENKITTPGKHEFVPQCGNYANIDFTKGCITSLICGEQAKLDWTKGLATGFYIAPWRECAYCYAQAKHKPVLKTFYRFDWQQLKEELLGKAKLKTGSDEEFGRKVERLRFGKRTETASLLTRLQFIRTLEICTETGTKGIIPTKFLEYNKESADLLKRTESVVLYDHGWDGFEKGAVSFGCTNEWRLEQAVKYGEAGVKTAIYLMIANPVIGPTKRDRKVISFIEHHKKNLIGAQLLPMRFKSKKLAQEMAGIHWDDAKSDKLLLSKENENIGCFEVMGGELSPKKFHDFWLDLIRNNKGFYRMCHHTNNFVWCGGCFAKEGLAIKHKRVAVKAIRKIPRPSKRKTQGKKLPSAVEKYQLTFSE